MTTNTPAPAPQETGAHALHTSEGARAYVAEYFATQIGRHDFKRYITNTLAADFACALAQQLSKLRAPVADERAAFDSWWNTQDEGAIRFDLEQYPQDLKATFNNLWDEAWRTALASAPVAGEAVYTLRVSGAIQAWTPTAAAFSIPDGEHQLFLSPAAP